MLFTRITPHSGSYGERDGNLITTQTIGLGFLETAEKPADWNSTSRTVSRESGCMWQ